MTPRSIFGTLGGIFGACAGAAVGVVAGVTYGNGLDGGGATAFTCKILGCVGGLLLGLMAGVIAGSFIGCVLDAFFKGLRAVGRFVGQSFRNACERIGRRSEADEQTEGFASLLLGWRRRSTGTRFERLFAPAKGDFYDMVANFLVNRSLQKLAPDQRERYDEEWAGDQSRKKGWRLVGWALCTRLTASNLRRACKNARDTA